MTLTTQSRLTIGLLICRISVFLVFLAWAYDKLVKGSASASAQVMADYYYISGVPDMAIRVIGAVQIIAVALLILGLFKKPVRLFLLALAILPFLLPSLWKGLYVGIFDVPHPTILFFSAIALCACAFTIYKLRDYDNLASLSPAKNFDPADSRSMGDLKWALFFCRLAVFIIFMVWVYSKIRWPDRGATRMRNFWLMPGFPEWGVLAFAWAELVVCFLYLFGYIKRAAGALFIFLSIMAAFTPRALTGMSQVVQPDGSSWHTILYYPAFCLLAASIFAYLLREYDTKFTLAKSKEKAE